MEEGGCLVLSRQRDEEVIALLPDGRFCSVVVVDIRGDKVRLGFRFPKDIPVHRKEVWEAIEKEGSRKATKADEATESQFLNHG